MYCDEEKNERCSDPDLDCDYCKHVNVLLSNEPCPCNSCAFWSLFESEKKR